MVAKDHAGDLRSYRHHNFKRIAFCMACNRAHDRQTGLLVVSARRKNYCESSACLLAASLRREIQPNQVACLWYIFACHHNSLPTGSPQSVFRAS
jgi:hypothetical protein